MDQALTPCVKFGLSGWLIKTLLQLYIHASTSLHPLESNSSLIFKGYEFGFLTRSEFNVNGHSLNLGGHVWFSVHKEISIK